MKITPSQETIYGYCPLYILWVHTTYNFSSIYLSVIGNENFFHFLLLKILSHKNHKGK